MHQKKSTEQDRYYLIFSTLPFVLCLSIVALLYRGYVFPNSNHGVEVLPILAILDNSLFNNDFAVQSFLDPGPRYFYQMIVASTIQITGIHISVVLFIFNFASFISFFLATHLISSSILRIAKINANLTLATYGLTATLSTLFILPLNSWASPIISSPALPSTFSMAFSIWAIYFSLNTRWKAAYLFVSIATLIQFLVGFLLGLALLPGLLYYFSQNRRMSTILGSLSLWGSSALAIYVPMRASSRSVTEDFDFLQVFGLYRVPHHWVPSTASISAWLSDSLMLCAGILSAAFLLFHVRENRSFLYTLLGIMLVASICVIANYVFVEIIPIELIGKLQFQRIMPYAHISVFLLCVAALWQGLAEPKFNRKSVLAIIAVLPLIPTILFSENRTYPVAALSALLIISNFLLAVIFSMRAAKIYEMHKIVASIIMVILFSFAFSPYREYLPQRVARMMEVRYRLNDVHLEGAKIANWIRENTNRNEVILYPPYWNAYLDTIQLRTQRAAYFIHKNVPFTDYGVYQWSIRARELLGHELTPFMSDATRRELWSARSGEEISEIAIRHGICYVATREEDHKALPGSVIVSDIVNRKTYFWKLDVRETWNLWKLDVCD